MGTMKTLGGLGIGLCITAAACGGGSEGTNDATVLETATHVAALEVNEDGSDVEAADAIEGEPLLMRGCGVKRVRAHLVDHFDDNDDGQVDGAERRAMAEEFGGAEDGESLRQERIVRRQRVRGLRELYDADASGDLSEAERGELEADLEARCAQRTERLTEEFDADGSGDLDEIEWDAAHAAIRERFENRQAQIVAEFDTDGDGALSEEERHLARVAHMQNIEDRRSGLRGEFDSDGSGDLDEAERAALRAHLRDGVRNPRHGMADRDVSESELNRAGVKPDDSSRPSVEPGDAGRPDANSNE
jgi:hypothetical protein